MQHAGPQNSLILMQYFGLIQTIGLQGTYLIDTLKY